VIGPIGPVAPPPAPPLPLLLVALLLVVVPVALGVCEDEQATSDTAASARTVKERMNRW
jgi:hypothetical protein